MLILKSVAAAMDGGTIVVWSGLLVLLGCVAYAAMSGSLKTNMAEAPAPGVKVMTHQDRARIAVEVAEMNAVTRADESPADELVDMIRKRSALVDTHRTGVRLIIAEMTARGWEPDDIAKVSAVLVNHAA